MRKTLLTIGAAAMSLRWLEDPESSGHFTFYVAGKEVGDLSL
jgi:hypothetical protein